MTVTAISLICFNINIVFLRLMGQNLAGLFIHSALIKYHTSLICCNFAK